MALNIILSRLVAVRAALAMLLITLLHAPVTPALEVTEIGVARFDDRPAIRVAFDGYLNRSQGFPVYLSINQRGLGPAPGPWILNRLGNAVLFPNVRVGGDYQVQIAAGLSDVNGSRLEQSVSQQIRVTDIPYGEATQKITLLPISAQISAPGYAAKDDQFTIELMLENQLGKSLQAHLSLQALYPVTISQGDTNRFIGIAPYGRQPLSIPLSVDGLAGTGKLLIRLSHEESVLERLIEIPIIPATRLRRFHLRGKLEPGDRALIAEPRVENLDPDSVDGTLNLSVWPPVDSARQLRLLSNAVTVDRLDRLSFYFAKLQESFESAAPAALQFGLETLGAASDTWIRVHAADLVLAASGPDENKARTAAILYLKDILQRDRVTTSAPDADALHARFASQAYAAYVLSNANALEVESARTLYAKQRRYALAGLPLIHLGLSFHNLGDIRRSGRAILEGVSRERSHESLGDHGSELRDAAWIVALLGEHGVARKYRRPLIELLATALQTSRRLGSPERLALIRAADAIATVGNEPWSAIVSVDEFSEHLQESGLHTRPITPASLQAGTELANLGSDAIYWSLDIEGHESDSPNTEQKTELPRGDRYLLTADRTLRERVSNLQTGEIVNIEIAIPKLEQAHTLRLEERKPAGMDWWFEGSEGVRLTGLSKVPHRQTADRLIALLEVPAGQPSILSYSLKARFPGDYGLPETILTDTQTGERLRIRSPIKRIRID